MTNLRSAFRQLQNAPGFSLVTLLTIALGIGANTAIFSVINAVMLRPLPYEEPDQLMRLYQRRDAFPKASWAPGQFFSMQADQTTFESVGAWQVANFNLATPGPRTHRGRRDYRRLPPRSSPCARAWPLL